MASEVRVGLLKGLVRLLRPAKEDLLPRPELLDGMLQDDLYINCFVSTLFFNFNGSVELPLIITNYVCLFFTNVIWVSSDM